MIQKRILILGLFFLAIVFGAFNAYADCGGVSKVTNDHYAVRAPSRLLYGIINTGLGWTQLFVEPVRSVKYQGQNVSDGIFDGFANAVYYTALGVWDLGTFWVPGQTGKDIAPKACVFETFQKK